MVNGHVSSEQRCSETWVIISISLVFRHFMSLTVFFGFNILYNSTLGSYSICSSSVGLCCIITCTSHHGRHAGCTAPSSCFVSFTAHQMLSATTPTFYNPHTRRLCTFLTNRRC